MYNILSAILQAILGLANGIIKKLLKTLYIYLFQVLHLKSNEMAWLCRHLGHTENVHMQNNRATMDLVERVHVTKIMLIQD